jgi:hypothetical protein
MNLTDSSLPHFCHSSSKPVTITECGWVSPKVKFEFDAPLTLKPGEIIYIKNGQWFLKQDGEYILIEGKWELK